MPTIENHELRGLGIALAEKETPAEIISQELGKLAKGLLGFRDIDLLEVLSSKKHWLSYHVSRRDGSVFQVVRSHKPPIVTRLEPNDHLYRETVEEIFNQLRHFSVRGHTLIDKEEDGWLISGGLKNENIRGVSWRAVRIEIAPFPAV